MSNIEDAIEIVSDYESGFISWEEAYRLLLDVGVADHVIREALGNEPI